MLCSCTHMATVGVKGLISLISYLSFQLSLNPTRSLRGPTSDISHCSTRLSFFSSLAVSREDDGSAKPRLESLSVAHAPVVRACRSRVTSSSLARQPRQPRTFRVCDGHNTVFHPLTPAVAIWVQL